MEIEVPQDLAVGKDTAQWVLDVIRVKPELHRQDIWWSGETADDFYSCGTPHCVAGWAAFAHQDILQQEIEHFMPSNNTVRGALMDAIPDAALLALEITQDDAERLFWKTSNDQALHAMEYLAKGEAIDWAAVSPSRYDPEGY